MSSKRPLTRWLFLLSGLLLASEGRDTLVRSLPALPGGRPTPLDSIATEKAYFSALMQADARTFQEFEWPFRLLLDARERAAYDSLTTLKARKDFIERYWQASNPNPLLPENDWLLEFLRRYRYAREHFRASAPPYVDARGQVYLKYGEPRSRFEDPGGILRLEFTNNERARKYFGMNTPINYATIANETWSYENVQSGFVVYFVKQGISFRQARDLMEILDDKRAVQKGILTFRGNPLFKSDPTMIYWLWADMIKRRAALSSVLGQAAALVRSVEESITVLSRATWSLDGSPQWSLRRYAEELQVEILRARAAAPSAAYDPLNAQNELEFFERVAQFRGAGGRTRIEAVLLAPLKKNLVKKVKRSSRDTVRVGFSALLRDADFEPVDRRTVEARYVVAQAARAKLPNAVGRVVLLAATQGEAELTLEVRQAEREKLGFRRQGFSVRDFGVRDSLLVSDVALFYAVRSEEEGAFLPAVRLNGERLSPYPFVKVRKKLAPWVYFEVYNLDLVGLGEEIEISYSLTAVKKSKQTVWRDLADVLAGRSGKPSVSVSYRRGVSDLVLRELVGVDLRHVKRGLNVLEVTVSSVRNPTLRATVWKKLEVE